MRLFAYLFTFKRPYDAIDRHGRVLAIYAEDKKEAWRIFREQEPNAEQVEVKEPKIK